MRVLGELRFTLPNPLRRHQKFISLQSFALKSDQQGSVSSHVSHRKCGKHAVALPEVLLDWLYAPQPLPSARQGIQPQKNDGRTLASNVKVHQPDHSTCMESCLVGAR